jgi:hypothetical protein
MAYPLPWGLVTWARRSGATWFDFGGVTRPEPGAADPLAGISEFKRSFTREVAEVGDELVCDVTALRGAVVRARGRGVRTLRALAGRWIVPGRPHALRSRGWTLGRLSRAVRTRLWSAGESRVYQMPAARAAALTGDDEFAVRRIADFDAYAPDTALRPADGQRDRGAAAGRRPLLLAEGGRLLHHSYDGSANRRHRARLRARRLPAPGTLGAALGR